MNGTFTGFSAETAGPDDERARQYWRDRLRRFDGPTRLGRGVPATSLEPSSYRETRLPAGLDDGRGHTEAGHGDQAGRRSVALAALALCLYRFSGRTLVSMGARGAGAAAWPGHTVPLLVAVSGAETFAGLVARVTDELRLATEAGPGALAEAMAELGITARGDGTALFTVSCGPAGDAADSTPVSVILADGGPGVMGVLRFDPRELDRVTAAAVQGEFTRILRASARQPELPAGGLLALSPREYRTVVGEWNQTAATFGPERRVHCLVEAEAARRPEADAVLTIDGRHSYGELNRRANQLASFLLDRLNVDSGALIAVAAERSFELAVFALAVLKAGAAYLPLDPDYPPDRLRLIVDDARPAAVLTLARHRDALADAGVPVVCADTEASQLACYSEENPVRPCGPDSLFCVIYTSGTTGRPKGVMLTHRGVSNSLRWERAHYEITTDDRLLQLASWSFSLAIIETFSPLCAGAALVMAPAEASHDTSVISRLVAKYGITLLSVVPAELKLLLDQEPGLPWTALRRVITGADRLSRAVVDKYFATCPSVPLLNVYGQTESAMDGLCWTCQPDEDSDRVPVGRPVSNARAYILDGDMRPVPVGVPGVLYCGGEGLARGYLGRPGLTAERMVPDPFGAAPGGRLCRSGDLARWRPDSAIELLGREDHQVQIGGTRVELGEIESVLCEHPGIREAAVALHAAPEKEQQEPADPAAWAELLRQLNPAAVERYLAAAEQAAAGN